MWAQRQTIIAATDATFRRQGVNDVHAQSHSTPMTLLFHPLHMRRMSPGHLTTSLQPFAIATLMRLCNT